MRALRNAGCWFFPSKRISEKRRPWTSAWRRKKKRSTSVCGNRAEVFACEADAQKAFNKRQKAHPLFNLTAQITRVEKYARAGRPKAGQEKACIGYQVRVDVARNAAAIARLLETKGRFILATNDVDKNNYPDARILADYKAQQTVEYGFRFLKNPEFLADTCQQP